MAEEETTLTAEELQRRQRMLQDLLGDNFDPNDDVRTQTRKLLEEQNIRNAASITAQASDVALTDYVRLLWLQKYFPDAAAAPPLAQSEIVTLRSKLGNLETATPEAAYDGPTVNLGDGPAAVTGDDLAKAYVDKYGANLPDGPVDHSDMVVTKADVEDAIRKYESIEITPDQIAAYKQESLQQYIDSRMNGIDPSDPDYAAKLEDATKWANDMAMPTDNMVVTALRNQTFLEKYPEMRMSDEQAQTYAAGFGSDPAMAQNVGSVISFYTDTGTAQHAGLTNYMRARADLRNEVEQQRADAYQNQIAEPVAELKGIGENVGNLAFSALSDSHTGIDNEAFRARQGEMDAAFESGDYNTALNIGNQLTVTVLADADARQLKVLTDNFDDLKSSAEGAGYTVQTPEDLQALLNGEDGAQVKAGMMGQGWPAGTNARNIFHSGEYTATENLRRDAMAMKSEIDNTAAKFEGIDLTEPDTDELTKEGVMAAESAAAPPLNLVDAAKGIIADNNGGARYGIGEAISHTFGNLDLDRLTMTRDIIGFEGMPFHDITTPEGMTSTLITLDVYKTGEIPSAERIAEIENTVDTAFGDEHAIDMDTQHIPESISSVFQRAHDSVPAIGNIFATSVLPEGYEDRLRQLQANSPHAPEVTDPATRDPVAAAPAGPGM